MLGTGALKPILFITDPFLRVNRTRTKRWLIEAYLLVPRGI